MRKTSDHPCGIPIGDGTRLALVRKEDGSEAFERVASTCGRPANARGADGVMRCVQHDRMTRGLPGGGHHYSMPAARELAPEGAE